MTESVRETLRALDAAMVGDYACFAGHLATPDDPRPGIPSDRLLDPQMCADIDARFVDRFGVFEPRAVRSIWMKWYLNAVLPPFLLADILLSKTLPVALNDTVFIMSDDSRIAAVKLTGHAVDSRGANVFARFEQLIFGHFAPLIDLWSARSDVTPRVYWSNVGNTFEAMLRRVESVSGLSPRLLGARRLLAEPTWPDGRPNPIHDCVHYVSGSDADARRRRVCCLQYLLPDRRFCTACPIDEARSPAARHIAS